MHKKTKVQELKKIRFDIITQAIKKYYAQNNKLPSERALKMEPWNLKFLRDPVYKEYFKKARALLEVAQTDCIY